MSRRQIYANLGISREVLIETSLSGLHKNNTAGSTRKDSKVGVKRSAGIDFDRGIVNKNKSAGYFIPCVTALNLKSLCVAAELQF